METVEGVRLVVYESILEVPFLQDTRETGGNREDELSDEFPIEEPGQYNGSLSP